MTPPSIDRLWAGWRSEYVASATPVEGGRSESECVFCAILSSDETDQAKNLVWRNEHTACILNAYPYGTGHVLVMPVRHVGELEDLTDVESRELWSGINDAVAAIKTAYKPNGLNVGFNLGEGSGAGIPSHLHAHAMPRWKADTNFITTIANAKVLPEALDVTWKKLREAWPQK